MIDPLLGEAAPSSTTAARFGVIVDTALAGAPPVLSVSIDGVVQSARWSSGYFPVVGEPVLVLVTAGPTGQSSNLVICAVTGSPAVAVLPPAEAIVTAVPASSPTISVAIDGISYTARVVGAAPAIGDRVLLTWRGSTAYAVGKIGTTPAPAPVLPVAPPAAPAPPPGGATSGTASFAAIDSATARAGSGWNSPSGQTVIQGSYGSVTYAGAWFYGTAPSSLGGRTLTGARVYLPARRRMGSYNDAVVIHLYAHTSASRPGGDVSRVVGPHDITLPPGWGGGWVDIPASLAAQVVAGGGLGIAGNPYAGLDGRGDNPQSGAVQIDWTA